jgi:hypothetical protein
MALCVNMLLPSVVLVVDCSLPILQVLDAVQAASNASGFSFTVVAAQGVAQSGFDTSGIAEAAAMAASADLVITVLGDGGEAVGYDSSE